MSSNTNQNNIINPKTCIYNCNTRIYWNTSENANLEGFTKKKHNCPNRSNGKSVTQSTTANKPNYYNKFAKQPKPKMSISFELLTGPVSEIQKKYEILSDIVSSKWQGSWSTSQMITSNIISLIVYYETPEGKRDEVKNKFENLCK
jgi:hypothetical protein